MNSLSTESLSSKDSNVSVNTWQPVSKEKLNHTQSKKTKACVNDNPKLTKTYDFVSLDNEVDLMDSLKTKVSDWVKRFSFHFVFKTNF